MLAIRLVKLNKQMMLLSNVTVSDLGCEALLQLGKEKLEGLHLAMLLRFLMSK